MKEQLEQRYRGENEYVLRWDSRKMRIITNEDFIVRTTHCFGFLPVDSLCSPEGDRHQTQQPYKHILRDYDKGCEGNEQGAIMDSVGVVVYKMFSYPLPHGTTL